MSVDTQTEEVVYEYQATDELGRPIGGKQVIKGKSWEDVARKVAQNHIAATRHIRKLTWQLTHTDIAGDDGSALHAEEARLANFRPNAYGSGKREE